jgi:hypothetical protein
MTRRTQICSEARIRGRLANGIEFFEVAEAAREQHPDRANAWVTLYVHAGIAAADVICCRALGYHTSGDDHVEAIALLRSVQPDGPQLANALSTLLSMKTRAGYSDGPVGSDDRVRAPRRAQELIKAARQRA